MHIAHCTFQTYSDDRGRLTALEEWKDIPFNVKRIYYIYDTNLGIRRGYHAHRSLEQILICIHGSCKILLDDGNRKEIVPLTQPNEGLYIPPGIWREMYDFSTDAVLLVLASELYDESDYIRDYEEFLSYATLQGA